MPWIYDEKSSTIIVLCHTRLVEYYLSKEFVILEHNSKNLSSLPNEAKQRVYASNIYNQTLLCLIIQQFPLYKPP